MRIDSHHHFWNYDPQQYAWINDSMQMLKQDYGPAELRPLCSAAGITGVVSVQARQNLQETTWLLEVAAAEPLVRGVVGWVELAHPLVEAQLEQLSQQQMLKGVRHVVQDEPDDEFLLGTHFNAGIRLLERFGLVYDLLIFPRQLQPAIRFVDLHPRQAFVLDHIAKPQIAAQFDAQWARDFRQLAERPNVVGCKFSGIVTEVRLDDWNVDLLRPYWETAWEAFGAQRMMFGSDWPVCLLRSQYAQWVTAAEQLTEALSTEEQQAFWYRNAQRAYRL